MNESIYGKILDLANMYASELRKQIDVRVKDMEQDDNSHYLLYQVLGVTDEEGRLIDVYQNKGRFLYKYAGSFLEEATIICIKEKYPQTKAKVKVSNTLGTRPKTFEIDCLVDNLAHEIKWRDATTDGDHITKEHTRVKAIQGYGYTPVRIMFYYPNRAQAKKIQETIETLYLGVNGKYFYGDSAWSYIKDYTDIDLLEILHEIAKTKK